MGLGSSSAVANRPFVTARKAFLSPWTGCDENGEGCGERMKEKERNVGLPVSFDSFGVLVERGVPSFPFATVWCS